MDLKFLANSDGEQAATTHGLAKDTLKAHRVSVTQNYCKCQTPLYEKNKLLLNECLGAFMHFETLFF